MSNVPRYYWDACLWIDLITQDDRQRFESCRHAVDLAEAGKVRLHTSAFTLAEVWKKSSGASTLRLAPGDDARFDDLILSDHVTIFAVDWNVGTRARRLLREHPAIGKPQDAIHMASCLLHDVDEFHTFDAEDLLVFNGKLKKKDGSFLKICRPPVPPQMSLMLSGGSSRPSS